MICTPHPTLLGDKIDNEIGRACNMYGEERRSVYRVLVGKPAEKRPRTGAYKTYNHIYIYIHTHTHTHTHTHEDHSES